MVTSLIYHERIRTTVPRAKELRKLADNMVTLAKKGDLNDIIIVGDDFGIPSRAGIVGTLQYNCSIVQ